MVAARAAAGRFAFVVVAGLGLGIVVGGVIGRLLMYLLARLNDQARGLVSDDGFVTGQLTVSGSLSLLGVGAFLGTWGGLVRGSPTSWHRLEPVRWLLRAGATGVLVIALADLVGDLRVLT